MTTETTQASLLLQVKDPSDVRAWSLFDAKYRDLILRYCRARGLQHSDAEDVHQWVMLNLAKYLPAFEYTPQQGRFRSYLRTIVRNVILQHIHRPKHEFQALDHMVLERVQDDADVADELWEQEWINHHYRLAASKLRSTFETRSLQIFEQLLAGRRTDEIAHEFGMSAQAVYKVKQRLRDRMSELIQEQVEQEEQFGAEFPQVQQVD